MFCGFCGKTIRDDAAFCPFCGEPVKVRVAMRSAGVAEETPEKTAESILAALNVEASDTSPEKASPARKEAALKPQKEGSRPPVAEKPFLASAEATGSSPRSGRKEPQPRRAGKKPAPSKGAPKKRKAGDASKHRKQNDRAFFALSLISKLLLLLLIPAAAMLPYGRIVYSASRLADMPLWQLIRGGTYTMGSSNPLQFTLIPLPRFAALLGIPLLVLLVGCFRRAKRIRLPMASLILIGDGLGTLAMDWKLFGALRDAVSDLSLATFETYVASMNDVVFKWLQNVVTEKKSFAGTFQMYWGLGRMLIWAFAGTMAVLGLIGLILCLARLFAGKEKETEDGRKDEANDDVPELTEDML